MLICRYNTSTPLSEVQWIRDGKVIAINSTATDNGPRVNIIKYNESLSQLSIASASSQDSGNYTCNVTNEVNSMTATTSIDVQEKPSTKIQPETVTVKEGENVTLFCNSSGSYLTITWKFNGSDVTTLRDSRVSFSDDNKNLIITNVSRENKGEYKCVASNKVGEDTSDVVVVSVEFEPEVAIDGDQEQFIAKGENVTLTCRYNSSPPVSEVRWVKDGKVIAINSTVTNNGSRVTVTYYDDSFSQLSIVSASSQDSGNYTCYVTNGVSNTTALTSMDVQEKPSTKLQPESVTVKEGENVTLFCNSSGSYPMITWKFKGSDVTILGDSRISFALDKRNLIITNVSRENKGEYKCFASNNVGNDTSNTAVVSVKFGPEISEPPREVTKEQGQIVVFSCVVAGYPTPNVTWTKNEFKLSVAVQSRFNVSSMDGNHSLTITDLQPSDSGQYRCVANNSLGASTSSAANLSVQFAPEVAIDGDQTQYVANGTNLQLTCRFNALPTVSNVQWVKDGTVIASTIPVNFNGSRVTISHNNESQAQLSIKAVSLDDAGNYTCNVTNSVGTSSRRTSIIVQVRPLIKTNPQTSPVNEGGNLTLFCNATGSSLSISWEKNGFGIDSSEDSRIRLQADNKQLTITNVTREDNGAYQCVVSNKVGNATSNATLVTVQFGSEISKPPMNATRVEGQTVVFSCLVAGYPRPDVAWTKNNVEFTEAANSRSTISSKDGNHSLTIRGVQQSDTGHYRCVANNSLHNSTSSPATLTVQFAPEVTIDGDQRQYVATGTNLQLTCRFNALPPVSEVQWVKDGNVIASTLTAPSNGSRVNISLHNESQAQLVITAVSLEDSGNYTCNVTNNVGISSNWTSIVIQVTPSIKTNLQADPVNEGGNLTLFCNASGSSLAISWTKNGSGINSSEDTRIRLPGDKEQLTITNVSRTDNGAYQCAASNNVGNVTSNAVIVTVRFGPEISQAPSDTTKVVGETAVFSCLVAGHPTPDVAWTKNDIELNITANSRLSGFDKDKNHSLTVTNVEQLDAGKYRCVGSNILGNSTSSPATLTVQFSPEVAIDGDQVQFVANGTHLQLTCRFTALPPASEVQWIKDETVIASTLTAPPNGSRVNISHHNESQAQLSIKAVSLTDSGNYTCNVSNVVGSSSNRTSIIVQVTPTIEKDPIAVPVKEGENFTLFCNASGSSLILSWTKNGSVIDPRDDSRIHLSTDNEQLTITNVSRKDNGAYQCVASNQIDNATSHAAIVTVQFAPEISQSPSNAVEVEGKTVVFSCVVAGYPEPDVAWTKNGVKLNASGNARLVVSSNDGNHELTVSKVQQSDAGMYRCEANNSLDTATSSPATLTVHFDPEVTIDGDKEQIVAKGDDIKITCRHKALPPASELQWIKDGMVISTNSTIVINNTRLSISHFNETLIQLLINASILADSGNYTCNVTNDVNSTSDSKSIIIEVKPSIASQPQSVSPEEGSNVTLRCNATGSPILHMFWTFDGSVIEENENSRISLSSDSQELTITNVEREDSGKYRCAVKNRVGNDTSEPSVVNVLYQPEIVTHPKNNTQEEGRSLNLFCNATGNPSPTLSWTKNGNSLSDNKGITFSGNNDTLSIANLTRTDSGNYRCVASNSLRNDSSSAATVDVLYASEILENPKNAIIVEGEEAVLSCVVDGNPSPKVTWTKNEEKLNITDVRLTASSQNNNHSLTITNVYRSDSGQYRCVALNNVGNLTSTLGTLTVQFAPEFSSSPQNVIVIEENKVTVTLNCTVFGNPTPDVKWTKDEIELSKNERINVSEIVGNISSLTITNTVREDEGQYRCVANNSVNTTTSSPGKLTVNFRADVLISGSEPKFVEISKQIQLTCQYNASPPVLEVQWVKDGNAIARNESGIGSVTITQFTESQSQLIISSSTKQDEGTYTCFVTNAVGNSSNATSVLIQVVPDPPQNITVDSKGSRVVNISWTPGSSGNSDIKNYTVEISENNQNFNDVVCQGSLSNGTCVVSSPSTTASLTGLFPWTTYNIRVFATNKIGGSNSSPILDVTTDEEVPSEAPSFVVTVVNSTAVNVSWQMLSKDKARGEILGYYVLYRVNSTPPWINKTVDGAEMTSLLVGSLNEHTTYEFAMQAFNSKGASDLSALLEKTTDQHKPSGPPQQVTISEVTSTTVKVDWNPVLADDRNGIIQGYRVNYQALPDGETLTESLNINSGEQGEGKTIVLMTLSEFTNYSISVLAFTEVGNGPKSGAQVVETLEDKPGGPPEAVTISATSSKNLSVSWDPVIAENRNGIIKGYKVNYQALPSSDIVSKFRNITSEEQNDQQTVILDNLNEFTNYSIRVLAFTVIGNGRESDAQVVETLEDKPAGRPQAVTVNAASSKNISVSWDPVIAGDRNGIIKGYEVNYRALPSDDTVSKFRNITSEEQNEKQTVILDDLNEFTNYSIRVLAFTVIGNGPESDAQVVETLEDKPNRSPEIMAATATSSKNISVSWDPVPSDNRNGIIKGYKVNYQALPSGDIVSKFRNITSEEQSEKQTVILDNLNEFTNYSIRVLAFTVIGNGPESGAQVVETLQDKPNRSPEAVTATAVSSKNISVSWDPVVAEDRNGIIQGYKVNYQALPSGDMVSKFRNITSEQQNEKQTFILDNLNEFTNYSIRVLAFTVIGNGLESGAQVVETLEDKPKGFPEAVAATAVSPKNISVSWDPVIADDRNGIIKGYKVNYRALPSGKMVANFRNITSEEQTEKQTVILENLNEFTNYSISVLAFTDVGNGPESGAQIVETLQDKPNGSPGALTATAVSSQNISVSWDPVIADDRNGIIKGYKVNYQALPSGDMVSKFRNITSEEQNDNQTVVLDDLNEFTKYRIRVLAFTVIGNGPESGAQVVETLEDKPTSSPEAVTAIAASSQSISVSWDPVITDDRNGIIKGYRVNYQALPGGDMIYKFHNITSDKQDDKQTVILENLNEFTNYSISVLAFTVIGNGLGSGAQVVQTREDKPNRPPEAVSASAVSSKNISVSWDPVLFDDRNGIIKGYKVNYQTLPSGHVISMFRNITNEDQNENQTVILDNLNEFTNYSIRVLAFTVIGNGQESGPRVVETLEDKPSSAPRNLSLVNTTSTSIFVEWDAVLLDEQNGIIISYNVSYQAIHENGSGGRINSTLVNAPKMFVNLTGLTKDMYYNISVLASTRVGDGIYSSPEKLRTNEDRPSGPPQRVEGQFNNSTSISVTWDDVPEDQQHGDIISYTVMYRKLTEENFKKIKVTSKSAELVELEKYTMYRIEVLATTRVGNGPLSEPIMQRTDEDKPEKPPQSVNVTTKDSSSIEVEWGPVPEKFRHGIITKYIILYNYSSEGKPSEQNEPRDALKTVVRGLKQSTKYTIQILAATVKGRGPPSDPKFATTEDPPEPPKVVENNVGKTEVSIPFKPKQKLSNGDPVSKYQVIVMELAEGQDPGKSSDPKYIKVTRKYEEKVAGEPYITAEFANNNEERTSFPVGDGKYYSTDGVTEDKRKRREVVVRYLNGKLNDGAEYVAFQRSFDREGDYESEGFVDFKTEKDHTVTIVVVVVVLVIVIAVIGGGIFFYRRRHSQPGNGEEELALRPQRRGRTLSKKILGRASGAFDNPIHNPGESVPVEDFDEHVRRLHANGDLLFSQEYGSLRPQADFTWNATLAQENRHKNRYNNIVAYDHSRVKLSPIQGVPGSDYINANFLDGYQRKKAYIASQGPLPETEDDFWRMIWEQDSKTIVMVTNLEERGRIKCHQYWPSEGGKTYGDVQVTLMQTVELSDFTIRTFTLKKANSRTERTLNQYHYTIWPDHGVPSCPTSLLTFVKKASGANPSDAGPMVVHCSAGVGRTGTFVVVDAMLQRIAAEKTVDVFGYVMTLRRDRNIMVQVEEQYVFIHEVLLEAIHSGYTEIRANDLRSHMKLLMQVSPTTGQTEMDEEFIRLGRGNAPQSKFQAANMSYNKTKNRYANVLAFDDTRVKLSMITGIEGSDYINANFIDGYMTRRAFIATQAPIPDTIPDFWRMIWEQESSTIVMLSKETESGKVKVHRYWPAKQPANIGTLVVEMTNEMVYEDYTVREIKLTNTKESASRVVRQYHYTGWPDVGSPESGTGLIDLIGQVQRWQQNSGNTTIAVHCSAGVGRTGVFCALSILIERLKSEGVVDVFQTVKQLRAQRPAMVQTKDQYEFIYSALSEYLDSFDAYSNFE